MADQDRNQDDRTQGEPIGDESSSTTQKSQRDQDRNRQAGGANKNVEEDDVAEDRNLSGSSTWLNLPDHQPPDDDRAENS